MASSIPRAARYTCRTGPEDRSSKYGRLTISLFCLVLSSSTTASEPILLKACGHPDLPPWTWTRENEVVGVCAEITKTLFGRLGVEVDFTYVGPWKRCQKNTADGEVDLNICLFPNAEREEYSVFSQVPMAYSENVLFVRRGADFDFESWDDLAGKTVGMALGHSMGHEFDEFLSENTTIERARTFQQNFRKLAAGRIDFIPFGRKPGLTVIGELGLTGRVVDLPTLITPHHNSGLRLSVSRKSPYLYLLPEVEKMMQEEGYDEWVESLLKKHTQAYMDERPDTTLPQ
jgi:polar amino acid transport system substrate-binding protein